MKRILLPLCALLITVTATLDAQTLKGWTKGKGFGWVWGKDDQIGALNAILSPERTLKAFQSIKKGKVYDLGVPLDRHSYKWPGHSARRRSCPSAARPGSSCKAMSMSS